MAAGLGVGSLLNWVGDYLCFAAHDTALPSQSASRPVLAVWRLLTSRTALHDKSLWPNAAVELVTSLFLVLLWERFDLSCKLLYAIAVCLFFLLIAIMDLRHRLVLNVLVYPVAAATLLTHSILLGGGTLATLLGGVFGLAPFLAAALLKPEGVGVGDVKLAALIGLMVGFPDVITALLVAVLTGGVAALVLLLIRHWKLESQMPYAPFLCLGAMFSLICAPSFLVFTR